MIRGLHGMFYTSQADQLRAFLRDKMQLPFSDVGGGWLIFDVSEADIGVHPVEDAAHSGAHDISFYCDDIQGTVADMRARGVEFDGEITDQGWGHVIRLTLPGGVKVQIYEPRYQKTTRAAPKSNAKTKKSVARPAAAAKSARRKPAAKKAPGKKPGKKPAKSKRR